MENARCLFFIAALASSCFVALKADNAWGQSDLEDWLDGIIIPDYHPEGEPEDVPYRNRDSLPEFQEFFERSGWTTNQFIEGLMFAATNNMTEENWADESKRRVSRRAVWKLSEINVPAVTNFFRTLNDDCLVHYKLTAIPEMLYYTNLEPDVLSYMRTLCVRTNIYDSVASSVMTDMLETLSTMPDVIKPAATNRVAQYLYFSLHHTTKHLSYQDDTLAEFLPAYSNSIQRLETLRHIAATTTNSMTRANVQQRIDMLSAIPTNQLNDISWITE